MANLKLELQQADGSFKRYVVDRVPARKLREALEMTKKQNETSDEVERLDLMVDFIADLFNNPEVTPDAIYDGLQSDDFTTALETIMSAVMGEKVKPDSGKKDDN
ncbi:phage tail assembly chaperone G [Enterococcus sp. CSURQ0835]|uniref:phage tail assembly chaperone G n=1 Tax=Enterococcus sp. CSURQ0835 TaxID=2681394 RepID=UPI001356769A|nr:hypothetical protein [Enterococcus sp. CSURQ0835]